MVINPLIDYEETVTGRFKPGDLIISELSDTAEHYGTRPVLVHKRKYEFKHPFSLISVGPAECDSVSPGSLQSCVSDVDYKIGHNP